ncbi:MAG: beta-N-acetylhexosaminidase [Bacteroidota bacterium]
MKKIQKIKQISAYTTVCFALALIASPLIAQKINIIPAPLSFEVGQGSFMITNSTNISASASQPEVLKLAHYLSAMLKPATGFSLPIKTSETTGIVFMLNTKADANLSSEGYTLRTTTDKVTIQANTPAGLFYGIQTLLQLLPEEIERKTVVRGVTWQIPVVSITDKPRVAWRGIMLDVSRHFFSKEYVKEYIDRISRYKFNRFHWHLTDDNGWRVEIKSLPKLTAVGAWRVPRTGTFGTNELPRPGEAATYGGFYTQEDIREIVQYARDRYIEVLPEIDVPGHSMAAIAAYPELCVTQDTSINVNPGTAFSSWFGNGKFEMHIDNTLNPADEKVYTFLDKVFTEVAALFPFEYIHMGGDECYKGYWERDAKVQAFMKKMNIKNGEELQSYFNKRVSKILADKKKKMIGWDEILEGGLAPGAAVMSWRGIKGGIEASHMKRPVVMSPSPMYYLDMYQGEPSVEAPVYAGARLKDVYAFDPFPPSIDSTFILGGQGNLWTEQVPTEAQAEYMTYPRAFAIAETLWSPKRNKNWDDFVMRVENHFDRFDQAETNYAPSLYDPILTVKKKDGKLILELTTEVNDLDIYYTLDNSIPNQYHPKYTAPIVLPEGVDIVRYITYRGKDSMGRLISFKIADLEKRVKN